MRALCAEIKIKCGLSGLLNADKAELNSLLL